MNDQQEATPLDVPALVFSFAGLVITVLFVGFMLTVWG